MKADIKALKLNPEQEVSLTNFIGRCVRQGVQFQIYTKMAATRPSGDIQEIYRLNVDRLADYGTQLKKIIADDTSEFKPGAITEPMAGGNITAAEMISMIKLMINEKVYNTELAKEKSTISALKSELDGLATPEERKAQLKLKIAQLEEA